MSDMIFLGPKSYTEQDRDYFYGRDGEAKALFDLINYNDFCVCYAESGEGKTSLINAGVAPLLRGANMLPVNIRFDEGELVSADGDAPDFDKIVWSKIEQELEHRKAEHGESMDFIQVVNALPNGIEESVWWKLRAAELHRADSEAGTDAVTPVLIFDQFEEVFTRSCDMHWTDSFFEWLERLYRDEYDVAPTQEEGDEEAAAINLPKHFKVLVSLRSDYVYELDYWSMTKHFIPSLKNNRYCLKPLTRENALTVAGKLPEENRCGLELDEIVRAAKVERAGDWDKVKSMPCVSALILSLILTSLDNDAQTITDKLKESGDNGDFTQLILNYVYDNAIEQCGLSRKSEKLWKMEETLIDGNGFRRRVPKTDACFKGLPLDKLAELHIINIINGDVEISHDSFRSVIANHNSLRRQRLEHQNQRIWRVIVSILMMLGFAGAYLYLRFLAYETLIPSFARGNMGLDELKHIGMATAIGVVPAVLLWFVFHCRMQQVSTLWCFRAFGLELLAFSCAVFYDLVFCPLDPTLSTYDDSAVMTWIVPFLAFASTLPHCYSKKWYKKPYIIISIYAIALIPVVLNAFCLLEGVSQTLIVAYLIFLIAIIGLSLFFLKAKMKTVIPVFIFDVVMLLAAVVFQLGINPFTINYDSCERSNHWYSRSWQTIVVKEKVKLGGKEKYKFGVVDAFSGDTIIPCVMDSLITVKNPDKSYKFTQRFHVNDPSQLFEDRTFEGMSVEMGGPFVYSKDKSEVELMINPLSEVGVSRLYRNFSLKECRTADDSLGYLVSAVHNEFYKNFFKSIVSGHRLDAKAMPSIDKMIALQRVKTESLFDSISNKKSPLLESDILGMYRTLIPEFMLYCFKQSVLLNNHSNAYSILMMIDKLYAENRLLTKAGLKPMTFNVASNSQLVTDFRGFALNNLTDAKNVFDVIVQLECANVIGYCAYAMAAVKTNMTHEEHKAQLSSLLEEVTAMMKEFYIDSDRVDEVLLPIMQDIDNYNLVMKKFDGVVAEQDSTLDVIATPVVKHIDKLLSGLPFDNAYRFSLAQMKYQVKSIYYRKGLEADRDSIYREGLLSTSAMNGLIEQKKLFVSLLGGRFNETLELFNLVRRQTAIVNQQNKKNRELLQHLKEALNKANKQK